MERKILSYSISLALCLLMFLPLRAQNGNPTVPPQGAPPKKEKKDAKEEVHYPLYNGMSVGLDLWGIGSSVFGGDFLSSEVAVDVNLKNRFFPIAELGYGSTDTWSDKGIHYKSNAPYFRIGMDYNTLYKKQHGHMLLVGLRYGVSSFKYDVDALGLDDPIYGGIVGNPNLDDEIWGGSLPYNHKGMKGSMHGRNFVSVSGRTSGRHCTWAGHYASSSNCLPRPMNTVTRGMCPVSGNMAPTRWE